MNWVDEGALYSQVGLFLREDLGRGAPHALRGPGDDRDPPAQPCIHAPLPPVHLAAGKLTITLP